MFQNKINGDPLTAGHAHRVRLDWCDRVICDQMQIYHDLSPVNEHCNEALGWQEHLERVRDSAQGVDLEMRWFVYQGIVCRPDTPAPLVVCFYEYYNTIWQRLADREGLVILAFEYHKNQRNPEGGLGAFGFGPKDDEIEGYYIVIERIKAQYGCDQGRVYLCGLSYGDMSSMIYAKRYGETLAGLASVNGPSSPFNLNRYGMFEGVPALPVIQFRSDDDMSCDGFPLNGTNKLAGNEDWLRNIRSHQVAFNRNVWLKSNGANVKDVRITTQARRAYIRYMSGQYDVIFAEFTRKGHILPVDHAEAMWQFLFSRYRRGADGRIEQIAEAPAGDEKAFGLVVGMDRIFTNGGLRQLGADCLVLEPNDPQPEMSDHYCKTECAYASIYAPVEILRQGFGLDYTYTKDPVTYSEVQNGTHDPAITLEDGEIRFTYNGASYTLYTNTCVVCINGRYEDLERPPLFVNGVLMVPVCEMATLLGLFPSVRNDTVYVTDHPFEMGYTLTRFLCEEILPDVPYVQTCTVTVHKSENGACDVSSLQLQSGQTLVVTVRPAPGFRIGGVFAAMNGGEVVVNRISENEFWVCNVMGDTEVEVQFKPLP